jgi:hypothetical protein
MIERRIKVNIVVLVKQVPDTETKIKIGADGKSIETSEIKLKLLFVSRTALGPASPFLAWDLREQWNPSALLWPWEQTRGFWLTTRQRMEVTPWARPRFLRQR